jgi:CheY-like chemotaxis protein
VVRVYEEGRRPSILLVDDNRGDATLIQIAFRKTSQPPLVTIAGTGEQGMAYLQGKDPGALDAHPDIIFLDLNLPSMHGLTFLEIVKSDPDLTLIPVLVISSTKAAKDIANCYRLHANGFVTKPQSYAGYLELSEEISAHWFGFLEVPPRRPQVPS